MIQPALCSGTPLTTTPTHTQYLVCRGLHPMDFARLRKRVEDQKGDWRTAQVRPACS